MWKGFLLAWIIGIALMGNTSSFLNISSTIIYSYFAISCIIFAFSYLIQATVYRRIILGFILFPLAILMGQYYANQQLEQRLPLRETQAQSASIIVYISHLNQLTPASIQQKAEILSGYHVLKKANEPIYWLLRSPISQKALTTTLAKEDTRDKTNIDSSSETTSKTISETKSESKKFSFKSDKKQLEPLQLGQYYRLTGSIRPNHSYANQGGFDSEQWMLQQNLMAGFTIKTVEPLSIEQVKQLGFTAHIQQQQKWSAQFLLKIEKIRLNIRNFISNKPLENKGLILALLTGDKSLLYDETEDKFQRFGISHLLAISGPHVLILASMVTAVIYYLFNHYRVQVYLKIPRPYLLAIPFFLCVLFYTAFVGFEIPAVRTLLMSGIMLILLLCHRQLNAFSILILSASLLLWIDPFSILSASFWLSFGASFILLRIYQSIEQDKPLLSEEQLAMQTWQEKSKNGLLILVESQWKVFVALFPMVMIFFQKVSWFSPIVNLIAIPVLGVVIVPLNILAVLCYFIYDGLGYFIWWCVDILLSGFDGILQFLDFILPIQLMPLAFTPMMIIAISMAVILLFLPKGILPKTWAVLAMVAVVISSQFSVSTFKLSVLDVGQGQSILIQAGKQQLLVDTGGYYDEERFSIGQNVVLPFLLTQGIGQLDSVLLSHLDHDHSGALPYLAEDMPIKQLISNELLAPEDMAMLKSRANPQPLPTQLCYAGQSWALSSDVSVQVLSPEQGIAVEQIQQNRNEFSCVLYVSLKSPAKYQHFLIMGDAGWETERRLIEQYPNLKVDVLILGHHGSKHSTSAEFLDHYRPKLAIASAGFNNRYRHPHQDVVNLLQQRQIPLWSTIEQGTIDFALNAQGQMDISSYRQSKMWLNRANTLKTE